MPLTVVLGGARSGKSAYAVRAGQAWGGPVRFVATAEAHDEEMAARIERHRADRPPAWETVESPRDVGGAIASTPAGTLVIVDCLTLWVANLVAAGLEDDDIRALAISAAAAAASHTSPVVVISNEVGSGIVPADPDVRRYRDLLGTVNMAWVEASDHAWFLVAGRPLALEPPDAT
ncbi:MAG: bifunctional adenosylcobinamide kinase/adenosylcobinamide-phosphate guanylyltransferase [Acidimicrobiia bacterium]|nr:bifunctional adenosylcobinamide kinase/adenosylcobinamide-phosphate guanylyltransferase [Acidimicrobiia bacterium]